MAVATRYADPSQTVGWANHSYERPTPLVAGADLEAAIELGEWWSLRPLQAHLRECRENHRPASFSLRVVKEWIEAQTGVNFALESKQHSGLHYGPIPLSLSEVIDCKLTHVWVHDHRLHVVGPGADALAPRLAPHNPVNANAMVAVFREDLRVRNPFIAGEFEDVLADARRVGLDLGPALDEHRKRFSWSSALEVLPVDDPVTTRIHGFLEEVLRRRWRLEPQEPWARTPSETQQLWLRRAADAPLVVMVPPNEHFELAFIASIGAGRTLSVRVARFPSTAPTPLMLKPHGEIDGGDFRIWLRGGYDEMLDGETIVPRRRRRAEDDAGDDD